MRVVHSDYENTALLDREPTNKLDSKNLLMFYPKWIKSTILEKN